MWSVHASALSMNLRLLNPRPEIDKSVEIRTKYFAVVVVVVIGVGGGGGIAVLHWRNHICYKQKVHISFRLHSKLEAIHTYKTRNKMQIALIVDCFASKGTGYGFAIDDTNSFSFIEQNRQWNKKPAFIRRSHPYAVREFFFYFWFLFLLSIQAYLKRNYYHAQQLSFCVSI